MGLDRPTKTGMWLSLVMMQDELESTSYPCPGNHGDKPDFWDEETGDPVDDASYRDECSESLVIELESDGENSYPVASGPCAYPLGLADDSYTHPIWYRFYERQRLLAAFRAILRGNSVSTARLGQQ